MAKAPDEKWILNTMKTLDLTRDEALEMWADDHDIDQGKEKDFDLPKEKQAIVKKMTNVPRKPTSYSLEGAKKRERKPNDEKRKIISDLHDFIESLDYSCQVETVNQEQKVDFHVGNNYYTIMLTLHREKK